MAFPPTRPEGATPTTIELIKACLEDTDICGRTRRLRLAAIAAELGIEASNKPWVGHVLALSCETLEKRSINDILTNGHGIYKKQWDKWKLGEDDPQWEGRKGEDKIQDLVYDLLIKDLIKLYQGCEIDGVKGLSVRRVCEKVKAEIGIVIIKETHLDARLKTAGVKRNLKGLVYNGKETQSESSTPTSIHTASVSPRPKPEGRLSRASSNAPSGRPTPKSHAYSSGGISSRPNTSAITQPPSQHHAFKSTNFYPQSRTNSLSNTNAFPHRLLQNPRDTPRSSDFLGEELSPAPTSGNEMPIEMEDLSHNGQLMPNSSHLIPATSGSVRNIDPHHFIPGQAGGTWLRADKLHHPDEARLPCDPSDPATNFLPDIRPSSKNTEPFQQPLIHTAEMPSNNAVTYFSEQLKLLTDRFDAEKAAREAQANEMEKWKNEYAALVRDRYEGVYDHQELRIKDLEQAKICEQTRSEKLSDDMETLQQKHDGLDATVQSLKNSNGELHSQVLELQSENISRAEHINDLQNRLKKLTARNNELNDDLRLLHDHNNSLVKKNESLSGEIAKLQAANKKLLVLVKEGLDEKLKVENNFKALMQHKRNLENQASNLQATNCELEAQVEQFQEAGVDESLKTTRIIEALQQEKETLQEKVKQQEHVNSILHAQVAQLQEAKASLDAELTTTRTAEQQRNDSLQYEVNKLQAENTKLNAQTTQLQEIVASLDDKIAMLERERTSLQEEIKSPSSDTNPAHQSLSRFSNLTFDSAIGESVRGSCASSRKRQSSITDEHEKKRQRSEVFVGEDDAAFLPIMPTTGLPIRKSSEGSRTEEGCAKMNMF
ncbi:hypothetical protein L207DRAFT_536278 [Hyaloscypha variabilis F]|uniref:Uncharacterized protein n=1 Tax=Hyaloscypha variabilis (strain UAMH 11265 / GT02V1 / F) TaxID=1149755 RepID=A0A2J6R1M8_HYAVF|nr:hypothetical protein L207DRAFT_536278 [Hyaloscypha variabilis F]